ncbi:SRPBCC family protein [Streptomyces sp. NPDC052043]|uniref:SRPBCC family protein n=1 Tax=Streptomyces sp. NPDC052043 TaxID=3365684 RepID=UPI0037D30D81
MPTELTGTFLRLTDGRPALRFTRAYGHPVERVWHLVTDPDELARWFPFRAEADLRPGGTVAFRGESGAEEFTGTVLAVDPPRHLSFEWGGSELHFDLDEPEEGHTRFTLTDVLAAENTAARTGAGWEVCLAALDARARGERFEGPHGGAHISWKACYEAYIAAGVPSGAPVPGQD